MMSLQQGIGTPFCERRLMHATDPSQCKSNSHQWIQCVAMSHDKLTILRITMFVPFFMLEHTRSLIVCRAGSSAAGRRATFSTLTENLESFQTHINHVFRKVLAYEWTSASSWWDSARAWVTDAHQTAIIAEVRTIISFPARLLVSFSFNVCFRVREILMVSHCKSGTLAMYSIVLPVV